MRTFLFNVYVYIQFAWIPHWFHSAFFLAVSEVLQLGAPVNCQQLIDLFRLKWVISSFLDAMYNMHTLFLLTQVWNQVDCHSSLHSVVLISKLLVISLNHLGITPCRNLLAGRYFIAQGH